MGFLILLLLCHASYSSANQWYESDSEINSVVIYKDYIPANDNYIIGSFRWNYISSYYSNFSVNVDFFFGDLLIPGNQIYSNGTNAIAQQKEFNGDKNTYLMLDQKQMTLGISGRTERYFGTLSQEDLNSYNNITYLNKIASTRSSGDIFNYLFYFNQ
jgi:hypothetical protein